MVKIFHSLIVLLVLSFNVAANEVTGFDEICRIYTEAQNSSMTGEALSTYIFDNVEQRVTLKDARDAHEIVFQVEPAKRYYIFKQTAELILKHPWDCPAAKNLMQ
jgi:hypothetical protein